MRKRELRAPEGEHWEGTAGNPDRQGEHWGGARTIRFDLVQVTPNSLRYRLYGTSRTMWYEVTTQRGPLVNVPEEVQAFIDEHSSRGTFVGW